MRLSPRHTLSFFSVQPGSKRAYTPIHARAPSLTVDPYEFGVVPDTFTDMELKGKVYKKQNDVYVKTSNGQPFGITQPAINVGDMVNGVAAVVATPEDPAITKTHVESKPHFYEWATAYVGMIAVQRKQRSNFRSYVAAETAAPVLVCCACKGPVDEFDFQFAGIVRSNSVRTVDDGMGPTVDEYFTLTIGGPQTILNNSYEVIHPGDQIAWTFYSEDPTKTGMNTSKRSRNGGPRRVGIKQASFHDEHVIGRALTFAKRNCRRFEPRVPHTHTPALPCATLARAYTPDLSRVLAAGQMFDVSAKTMSLSARPCPTPGPTPWWMSSLHPLHPLHPHPPKKRRFLLRCKCSTTTTIFYGYGRCPALVGGFGGGGCAGALQTAVMNHATRAAWTSAGTCRV